MVTTRNIYGRFCNFVLIDTNVLFTSAGKPIAANKKMKRLFGTDGIRGLAGDFPLDKLTISAVGRSLARQFTESTGRTPRFVTGRDTRESGPWIEAAFQQGAAAEGADCLSAGVITTPGVAYITSSGNFDAGIVISASHNPFEDNGIKIFSPSGKKLDESTEIRIEQDIANSVSGNDSDEVLGNVDESQACVIQEKYLEYLRSQFKLLDLSGLRLAIDCANGASSVLAPRLFASFGADAVVINNQPDGRNINKDCGSLHLDKLQQCVVENKARFGVAFDGDADRALFVDENGSVVDGDGTLWILSKYFQDKGRLANRTVVSTVMSNIGLEIALTGRGINLKRAAVGDKYVLEELLATGSTVGGEQSGHIIFPEKSLVGDGMMTSLFLLEALVGGGNSLAQAVNGFTRFPQVLLNVKVREKKPFESVPEIAEVSRSVEAELHGNGRLLLRYSGTENLARVMIEGKDHQIIESQAKRLVDVIGSQLG